MFKINNVKIIPAILATVALTACNKTPEDAQTQAKNTSLKDIEPPNIVFIYTDDQAPWALGRSGNKQALTPNLDKLSSQGMYLPNAYATTPVCSPSRASLLTSQYGYELGIDDWINDNPKAKTLTGHQFTLGLDTKFETWPEILQQSGYYTGLIGKWHLGKADDYHPKKHGYHEFVGFRKAGAPPDNPQMEVNGVETAHKGLTFDILTDYAIDFINKNKANKFALSLHLRAPHYRFLPVAPEDEAPYKNMDMQLPHPDYPGLNLKRGKKLMREYLSSVRGIDRNVGRIMQVLDELNLADNTFLVFTSDHGYNIGLNGIWHKGNGFWLLKNKPKGTENVPGGQRPNMYDPSLKVPTIVRWPNAIKANTENRSTMPNIDWFPTLVSIAKGKVSDNNIVRGKDFLPALLDENTLLSTDYYAAYSTQHQSITHMRMYSDGKYKLIRDFNNQGRDEFYDLVNDPDESHNLLQTQLTPQQKAIVTKLHNAIIDKMRSTNDPVFKLIKS
ncbi:N-acetylgalactosamine 6-sulfate sulfatase [Saccharobesus litoralis]|uniref:N-acetylgalactosamine 6-sulfate sulfatase n=1 Tax=Saccharobesus litoralis TaxID=2172099 RepID=A0A2S0VPB6_9ALTE|nr:sulfatase-like hydrolase/transferase [Saccharobesus litoralis]AWB66058.1 N-acetylgalactosamine 6-sulfate sulfatase [Saccharobesus litoralis]